LSKKKSKKQSTKKALEKRKKQKVEIREVSHPLEKMRRKDYERELDELQMELSALQDWIKRTGQRVVIVFEGRDAAGKGGTIRALTERLSPRVFQVVALPAPSDRERTQLYMQRYIPHFPAAGEVVIFDRSWYNRAGVEVVMGFCTEDERDHFLVAAPWFEDNLVENGIVLIKYWLEVGEAEQERRFRARIEDPVRQWKLSPMDLESRRRWYEYSRARDKMLDATDTERAPWWIVRSDDKKRARLNVIRHLLSQFPYDPLPKIKVKLPDRDMSDAYDDQVTMIGRRWIEELG
jgi:polyphosphate kinase 2